jgi:hypothetical protein
MRSPPRPRGGRANGGNVLAPGGQGEENAMVRRFLGRDPSNQAFIEEITGRR